MRMLMGLDRGCSGTTPSLASPRWPLELKQHFFLPGRFLVCCIHSQCSAVSLAPVKLFPGSCGSSGTVYRRACPGAVPNLRELTWENGWRNLEQSWENPWLLPRVGEAHCRHPSATLPKAPTLFYPPLWAQPPVPVPTHCRQFDTFPPPEMLGWGGCQKSPSHSLLPRTTAQSGPANPPQSPSPAEALTQISSLSLPPAQQAPCWACPGAECAAPSTAPRAAARPRAPPGTGLGARTQQHPQGHPRLVPPSATRPLRARFEGTTQPLQTLREPRLRLQRFHP